MFLSFVSNGYLVFRPDIHPEIGRIGESAYNSVISAAEYLRKMPWVNADKIGIQGHSYGGFEVNYLIGRTNLFAAAASSAGTSDFISLATNFQSYTHSAHNTVCTNQWRMDNSIWTNRSPYLDNSPLFLADNVTSPLLIMHNTVDPAVPWSQSFEYFTALRYLKKKVWMLQYDNSGHTLNDERDKYDYTIRLHQFFDHYLKGKPAPEWMTQEGQLV